MNLSLMTAAALTSITALLIAFVAYPWQKRRDREIEIHSEKRRAFSRYFAAFDEVLVCVCQNDSSGEVRALVEGRKALNELVLSAEEEAVKQCTLAMNTLSKWTILYKAASANSPGELLKGENAEVRDAMEKAKSAKEHALLVARISLHGPTSEELTQVLRAAFRGELKGKL